MSPPPTAFERDEAAAVVVIMMELEPGLGELFAPRVGDVGCSRRDGTVATRPRGVQVSVAASVAGLLEWLSLEGEDVLAAAALVGEVVGVVEWRRGDGEDGDSGRRKGEARGELNDSGEGL
jgi:hypothetical protein